MATAWSTSRRVQELSQGRVQILPVTAGKGFFSLTRLKASLYFPLEISLDIALGIDMQGAGGSARALSPT